MAKKLLIIDTDCGIDDAQAIMMALAAPDVEVLGVTCCFGNTSLENVCQNVLRVLAVCKREEASTVGQEKNRYIYIYIYVNMIPD